MQTLKSGRLLLLGAISLLAGPAPANAGNINAQGSVCVAYNAGEVTYVDQLTSGARNIHATPLSVVCPIPRSPLASGASGGIFYIDGDNSNGASTSCTLYAYNYTGTLLGSSSFTTSLDHYDQAVSLTAAQLPTYAYTMLFCVLPGSGNGVIRGVTSVQ